MRLPSFTAINIFLLSLTALASPPRLSQESINTTVLENLSGVRDCYSNAERMQIGLTGKVIVAFDINELGAVIRSSIESSTLNNIGAENCIAGEFKKLKFPKPTKNGLVSVRYPVSFSLSKKTPEAKK